MTSDMVLPPDFFRPLAPLDSELAALDTCLRALLPLDHAARRRVCEYLDDRLSMPDAREPAEVAR